MTMTRIRSRRYSNAAFNFSMAWGALIGYREALADPNGWSGALRCCLTVLLVLILSDILHDWFVDWREYRARRK